MIIIIKSFQTLHLKNNVVIKILNFLIIISRGRLHNDKNKGGSQQSLKTSRNILHAIVLSESLINYPKTVQPSLLSLNAHKRSAVCCMQGRKSNKKKDWVIHRRFL